MFENKQVKIAMNIAFMVSVGGVAAILHNAPVSAETYTPGAGAYVPTDYTGTNAGNPIKAISGGVAKAQIMKQITSATAGTLDFGKVVPTSALGTIVIAADGSITNSGGARYIPNSGAHVAQLTFSGEPNQKIEITTAASATIANGVNTMTIDFLYPAVPSAIGADGNAAMSYGGTLNVGANQAQGIYSGTYDIFVTYVS